MLAPAETKKVKREAGVSAPLNKPHLEASGNRPSVLNTEESSKAGTKATAAIAIPKVIALSQCHAYFKP